MKSRYEDCNLLRDNQNPSSSDICHTSDGGEAFGWQAGVKPEAARDGGPKGQALHQLANPTS
jgi:hypothetical protein